MRNATGKVAFLVGGAFALAALPVLAQEAPRATADADKSTSPFNLETRAEPARFPSLAATPAASGPQAVELEFAADGAVVGAPLDISLAPRMRLNAGENGDIAMASRGAEVRVGSGLARRDQPQNGSRWYVFAASDDEALTWQPGARSEFGGGGDNFSLQQDRVEIGDLQAGVTYERNGVQASLAYVEREISVSSAAMGSHSREENFAGVTLTMRR